jgi:hypothetical protein
MFRTLSQYLPPDLLNRAFDETLKMHHSERALTLPDLLPKLSAADSDRALVTVSKPGGWDEDYIHRNLAWIAPFLVGKAKDKALRKSLAGLLVLRPHASATPLAPELQAQFNQQAAQTYNTTSGTYLTRVCSNSFSEPLLLFKHLSFERKYWSQ